MAEIKKKPEKEDNSWSAWHGVKFNFNPFKNNIHWKAKVGIIGFIFLLSVVIISQIIRFFNL